jgi:hypothetical protein
MPHETCKDNISKERCTINGEGIGHQGVCTIKNCPVVRVETKVQKMLKKLKNDKKGE